MMISTTPRSMIGFIRRPLGVARYDQPDQPEQRHRPDERHEEADEETSAPNAQERGEDPAPHEGADDPDDDVSHHAVTVAADHASRQRARDQPDQDEQYEVHGFLRCWCSWPSRYQAVGGPPSGLSSCRRGSGRGYRHDQMLSLMSLPERACPGG